MSLRKTPFPKPSFLLFIKAITAVSATIVFILVIFQPFGTSEFNHPFKYLMLFGYGFVILLSGIIFYYVSSCFISNARLNRWSVVDEVIFLFFVILICQVSCYLYWAFIIAGRLNWIEFIYFFGMASLISIVPVTVYLLFIYQKYKEVKFLEYRKKELEATDPAIEKQYLTIYGAGKNEKIKVAPENLFLVKSEDNYVILYLYENGKLIKRMMRNTLSDLEQQIGASFFRCHRSFIINPSKIKYIAGNITNTKISLIGIDVKIPVSRPMVDKVKLLV